MADGMPPTAGDTAKPDVSTSTEPVLEPPAPAPTLTWAVGGPKVVSWSWSDVVRAVSYELLEDPGDGRFVAVAEAAPGVQQLDLEVAVHRVGRKRFRLDACNEAGCVSSEPVTVGEPHALIGYVKADAPIRVHGFGGQVRVSADGTTMLVTADSISPRVYVFERPVAGAWSQQTILQPSHADPGDQFGASTALSADGSTVVVGAPAESSDATGVGGDETNDDAPRSGAVYVFERDGDGDWAQQAYLKASNADPYDAFGTSVSLSADGSTLAVGAVGEDSAATGVDGDPQDALVDSGAVYVFRSSDGESWSESAYVKASNTGDFQSFGGAVALAGDGSTLAVGATGERSSSNGVGGSQADDGAYGAGAVYVFELVPSGWTQVAYVKASNTRPDAHFGYAVGLSERGDVLAVGAPDESSNGTGVDARDNVFDAPSSGAMYLFSRSSVRGSWEHEAFVKASNAQDYDGFGAALGVSADGSTVVVGAVGEGSAAIGVGGTQDDDGAPSSGAVYTFERDARGRWGQAAYVKASNTGAGDAFGVSVGVSGDGSTLVVGARNEDSSATGVGGDPDDNATNGAGAVYLY